MKKRLFLVTVFMAGLLLLACGKKADNNPEGLTEKPSATPFVTPAAAVRAEGPVKFSIAENFLSNTGRLELSAEGSDEIYYTLDGNLPTEKSTRYKAAIMLVSSVEINVYTVSARAKYPDGHWSDTVTRTYITGRKVANRYNTLVFSITTPPDNLWNYETGIFAAGKIFDDYVKEHPREEINGGTPANYNQLRGMEGERPVYVEVFNSDGSLVLAQNSGLRCYGGWSRASAMKPMKLLARKQYSETDNKFRYPFFTTAFDENDELIDSFKRLVLRSSGNDNNFAFIREELFQSLAMEAGYLGKSVRPAAVYVNGEYYGQYWLTEPYHESYFENHLGKYKGKFEILEGAELYKSVDEDEENLYAVEEFNQIDDHFAYADLKDEATFKELCDVVDVQNYLEYYAFQIFIANEDWPVNNYKVYRYYPGKDEGTGEGLFDGRWRFLLHDLDYSTGIYDSNVRIRGYDYYLGKRDGVKEELCPLFGRLMQRDDCKKIFFTKLLDLINGIFAEKHFNAKLDEMNASRMQELSYTYGSGKLESWVSRDQLDGRLNDLKKWIVARCNYMLMTTPSFFRLEGVTYELKVTVPEKAEVSINSWTATSDFKGKYFEAVDTKLTAEDKYGRPATGWKVDGESFAGESLTINSENLSRRLSIVVEPLFEY